MEVRLDKGPESALAEVEARTTAAPPGYTPLPRGPKNVRVTAPSDAIQVSWDPPHSLAERRYTVFLFDPNDRIGPEGYPRRLGYVDVRGNEPTTATFTGLRPQSTFLVEPKHYGMFRVSVERTVRTTATDRARAGSGEVPIPFWW